MEIHINGTIVITDPCYLKGFPIMSRDTIYGDWSCMVYKGTLEDNIISNEWDDYYFKFFSEYNSKPLIDNPEERKNKYEEFKEFKKTWMDKHCLGEFCADAGKVGIFRYDSLGEKDIKWIEEHPWCAAVIKDFNGDVDIIVKDNTVHVVGKGNFDFFSTQSGL